MSAAAAFTKCLADIAPERLRWLWPGRVPLGKLTVIAGDPGLGKSLVSIDMAARVSRGAAWPDGTPCDVGQVLLLSAEDDAADTIRPRLDAADANPNNVHLLEGITDVDGDGRIFDRYATLADVATVDTWLARHTDTRLVVIDPVSAHLGAVDSHNNAELRSVLAPWAKLAAARAVAVVAISHLTKNAGSSPIYRVTGSLAFVAAARSVWCVAKDKQNEARRLFLAVKSNLAPDKGGLAFELFQDGDAVVVDWKPGAVDVDLHGALAPDLPDRERPERTEAMAWLIEQLVHGPVPVKDLKREAAAAGVAWRTLERAKAEAGASARKRGKTGGWVWELNSAKSANVA